MHEPPAMKWTAPLRPVVKAGDTLIDRLFCVFGAVLFCQLPEFIQQYLQRLGGRLDEARRRSEGVAASFVKRCELSDHARARGRFSLPSFGRGRSASRCR